MTLLIIITLTVAISLLSFVGIFLTKASMFSKRKFSHISVSFAAGVLIAAAFIQILPEAFHTTDDQDTLLFATLCGLVIGFLMERSLLWSIIITKILTISIPQRFLFFLEMEFIILLTE